VAIAGHDQFMAQYHDALKKEILNFVEQSPAKPILETIYIGGGTPSTWPDDLLLDTSGTLREVCNLDNLAEFTLEINPGTVRTEQFAVWKECGINRLSIGVQSQKDEVLKKLNRHQKLSDVLSLLDQASKVFDNISVDIILGLPGVSAADWRDLLNQLVTWPIQHVSLYFLTVHEDTALHFQVQKNRVVLPPDEEVVELYYWSRDFLRDAGFVHYELSSFARPGRESKHNTIYWERKPYKGFGIGACSFDGQGRFQNEKNLFKYMQSMQENKNIIISAEGLSAEQIRLEKLMLGLRRSKGVENQEILEGMPLEMKDIFESRVSELVKQQYLVREDGRLNLTPRGLVVENEIVSQLMR
jgi:oxygen-independent coproporphyrinogen-3 oxidase